MNDLDTLADSESPRRWRISPIAIVLIFFVLAGAYVSASYTRTMSNLLREQREFAEVFGDMTIEDPSQVAIVAVSPTATDLPPWLAPENVSIFRVHVPANYRLALATHSQLVAADTPLTTRSGGSSSSSREPKAREIQITVSTHFEDGRLEGSLVTNSMSTPFSFTNELAKTKDDFVLDTIATPGQPMRMFATNEAICIWRLRNKEPGDKMINQTKLYPGCAIYLYEDGLSAAFNRWSNGASSSMTNAKP